ncbi:MAG: cytochrome C oxidase subunit IV family protein [Aquihabitans sp.]
MSADATTVAPAGADPVHKAVAHHGPTDVHYVKIAVALAVITAVEVAWSYLPVWDDATGFKAFVEVAGLLLMMGVKFVVVAAQFMHLKFDNRILTRLFYGGLFLAIGVYVAALFTFQIFGNRQY